MAHRYGLTFTLLVLTLLTAGGAGCPQFLQSYTAPGVRVLPENATLADVIHVVNSNSAKIQSLSTDDATINLPLTPALRTNLNLQRPRRFRLQAATSFTGPEVDLGSNDDIFWVWVRSLEPPSVYVCRHDQFHASAVKQMVPVEPEFVIEALGVATLDPNLSHQGPMRLRGGRLEVRTALPTPSGVLTKVTVVDEMTGWVVEQHLYDPQGQRLASALLSKHWRDPLSGAAVPKQIELSTAASRMSLQIDVRTWQVNQSRADLVQLYTLPNFPGYSVVDLADPNLRFGQPGSVAPVAQPWQSPQAAAPTPGLRGRY